MLSFIDPFTQTACSAQGRISLGGRRVCPSFIVTSDSVSTNIFILCFWNITSPQIVVNPNKIVFDGSCSRLQITGSLIWERLLTQAITQKIEILPEGSTGRLVQEASKVWYALF